MKPELTPELKEVFFAQYYKQKVILAAEPDQYGRCFPELSGKYFDAIHLRPLWTITETEAIHVAKCLMYLLWGFNRKKLYCKVDFSVNLITVTERYSSKYAVLDTQDGQVLAYEEDLSGSGQELWAYQELISLGFAMPFRGHSVEALANAGWIKLKTE